MGACFSCALRVCDEREARVRVGASRSPRVCSRVGPVFLLVGGEELRHVLRGDLVHVAGLTDVAVGVVDGAERFFAFGVCAVPEFGAVGGVRVDVVQQGFEAAHVLAGCRVAAADCAAPFVVYEASRVAAEGDGDGHCVVVADVFGEVGLLLVGERVPRVGERLRDGEVGGAGGEEVGGFGGLVDLGGVHGCVSFSVVVGVFSCVGFSVAHVWALCWLSRVKGGVERCVVCHEKSARWRGGGGRWRGSCYVRDGFLFVLVSLA